jgi:hypothetical protein
MQKILGKYYFKKFDDEEYKRNVKANIEIVYDCKTPEQAMEYAIRLKSIPGKSFTDGTVHFAYFPTYSETEGAFMAMGHHTH